MEDACHLGEYISLKFCQPTFFHQLYDQGEPYKHDIWNTAHNNATVQNIRTL